MRFLLALLTLITICSVWAYQDNSLKSRIVENINSSAAKNAYWSISVRNSKGDQLLDYNADMRMTPASNLKLLTSAAILDTLGPEYRFQTNIYGQGKLENGVWHGNLYVVGSGDPSISGLFYASNRLQVFENFYKMLKEQGISELDGNIVGNAAYFDAENLPTGWRWDDLSYYYAAETGPLSFNNNCVELEVKTGAWGANPNISWFPFDTDYVTFINQQTISRGGYEEYYRRMPGMNIFVLRSKLPANYVEHEPLAITNPTLFFVDTFEKYLKSKGTKINGTHQAEYETRNFTSKDFTVLAKHQSVPLKEMLKHLNKTSDNFYTEMLLKTAAAERYKMPGSTINGLSLVKEFAGHMGFNQDDIVLTDGSGLGANNLISTGEMTQFLTEMRNHTNFSDFEDSLSIGGVDGSLAGRFADTKLRGKIKGKSGYITGTKALSGYLTTASGQTVQFSIITNHFTNSKDNVGAVQGNILELIYEAI
jgi:serine-type D-Ala-D-Ala carboxypeptidase/endopeptidase (penicillin-binding protein 4)